VNEAAVVYVCDQAHKEVFLKFLSQQHMSALEQFIESSIRRRGSLSARHCTNPTDTY